MREKASAKLTSILEKRPLSAPSSTGKNTPTASSSTTASPHDLQTSRLTTIYMSYRVTPSSLSAVLAAALPVTPEMIGTATRVRMLSRFINAPPQYFPSSRCRLGHQCGDESCSSPRGGEAHDIAHTASVRSLHEDQKSPWHCGGTAPGSGIHCRCQAADDLSGP